MSVTRWASTATAVLLIEGKPLAGGSIAWVTAQASMYARIMQGWVDHPPSPGHEPTEVLREVLAQRRQSAWPADP